eukprot:CAMPEP_0172008404 /NCGR_PEP_ID=MMETSP1041-20130122/6634_1 /TAXON_ID=464988 /ORGANISM="Hemiselmis andersenii, Strain CCMP439" /LENGTH=189 /DNA_ID=CAMNT_0012662607 /DNA_START=290 /DNA_END=858 /DNA_ORIENTATION=+
MSHMTAVTPSRTICVPHALASASSTVVSDGRCIPHPTMPGIDAIGLSLKGAEHVDKLPQHDSKRVNVRPLVKGLAPVDLGRDVDHRARGAHRVDVGRLFDPREPEVADLDRDRGSLSGQQKVLRLDIPMHKPPPVKVPHPASALPRHPQPGRKGVVGCLPRTEVVPHVMLHQLRDYCKRGNLGDCPEKR